MKIYARVFVILLCLLFAFPILYSPVYYFLCRAGVYEYDNVGNVIEVEKVYDEDHPFSGALNGFEEFKRTVRDIYINYLPAYVETTFAVKEIKTAVNAPFVKWLTSIGDELFKKSMNK